MFFKVILLCSVIAFVYGECDPTTCLSPPKHYKEMGCEPVKEGDSCCATHYNCRNLKELDHTKCHFKGNTYNVGDRVPEEETTKLCSASCFCDGFGEMAKITCAQIECPSLFNSALRNCVQETTLDSCCVSKYICEEEEISKHPKCHYDDREYLIGASIYPENAACHKCICQPNFDNSTIIDNPNCKEIECGLALRSLNRFVSGCIPIYYGNDKCCPIDWRCPNETDTMVAATTTRSADVDSNPNLTCEFGSLKLKLNDEIESSDKCVECKCTFPPIAHCIKKSNC